MHDVAQQTFPLYDRILKGTLTQRLIDWREEDVSIEEMTFRLRDLDVVVSSMTVRRWLQEIEAA